MNITPTLDLNHPEYHFAANSNIDYRCCGLCWRSSPKQYIVDEQYKIKPVSKADYKARVIANQRLATLISHDLNHDPIAMNDLFERLKYRVNYDITNGTSLTSEKLAHIINIIYEVKFERNNTTLRNSETRVPDLQRKPDAKRYPRDREKSTTLP